MSAPVEFSIAPSATPQPPAIANPEAERAVLAALLIAKGHVLGAALASTLTADMFAVPVHRALYDAIAQLRTAGTVVDPMTIRAALEASGQRAHVTPVADLIGALYGEVPTTDHAHAHAALIREAARRRELVRMGKQLALAAADPTLGLEAVVGQVSKDLLGQARPTAPDEGFQHIRAAAVEALQAMDDRRAGVLVAGVPTGIPEIDHAMGNPPQRGTMVLVAGPPSCGKTSTVWQILQDIALAGRGTVGFVSAEMRTSMLMNWSYAQLGSVPLTHIQSGELQPGESARVVEVCGLLGSSTIHVDQTNRPPIAEILTRCRLLRAQHPDLIAIGVDFIQLLQDTDDGGRADLREQVLRSIAYDLKAIALECDVVMFVLAQVNAKQIANRPDKRPLESDIAGSGGPMEAADVALMIYREAMYSPSAGNDMEIAVAKNKFGPRGGVARVWWEGQYVRVASPKRRHDEKTAAKERDRQPDLNEGVQ